MGGSVEKGNTLLWSIDMGKVKFGRNRLRGASGRLWHLSWSERWWTLVEFERLFQTEPQE